MNLNPFWSPKRVELWAWGMGAEHIEFAYHRWLPLIRFRPTGDVIWRYRWLNREERAVRRRERL